MARSSSPAIGCSTLRAVLQASDPKSRALDVKLIPAHANGLRDAQAVPKQHEQERVVADAVAPFLGCLEQAIDLRTVQEVLVALVRVGGFRLTLYTSPVGRHRCVPRNC